MVSGLSIEDLYCELGPHRVEALREVHLAVEPGELVCVAGRSGAGKSTLARCVTGLIPRMFPGRVSGRIRIDGRRLEDLSPWEVAQRVGLVSQDPSGQIFTDVVEDEVAFAPENLGLAPAEIVGRLDGALTVTGLTEHRRARIRSLSHGQRQRVALASVLALRPRLLILDEPTALLDEQAAHSLFAHLSALAAGGEVAVLVLEHRTRFVERYGSRLIVIDGGTVAYDGSPTAVHSSEFCASFGLRPPVGPRHAPCLARAAGPPAAMVASAKDLAFAYEKGRAVLSDVNLDVRAGAAAVVCGPNGSGKTTLLRLFAGLLRPSRGRVHLHHSYSLPHSGRGVGFVGQEPIYLFRYHDVEMEYRSWRPPRDSRPHDDALLERLDLSHLRRRHPLALSEGEKRRLAIAAVLSTEPQPVFLDEPSVGFDGQHLDQMLETIDEYTNRGGAAVIASNDPDVLDRHWPQRLALPPPGCRHSPRAGPFA
jgi:energy-coupling factor transport system ATP-binding protein